MQILVVDDHESVRRGIRAVLSTRAEWVVCGEAADGFEAVEKAKQLQPDVVLMDISMPRMDGLQATRIIRREIPQAEVIIVTQNDPKLARWQATDVNAHGFVAKSNLVQDLLPLLENLSSRLNGARESATPARSDSSANDLFGNHGEMSTLMRSTDWSKTPLGSPESWSPALRMMVRFLLANRFPQLLWWGPQFCCLYNDAYIPVLGVKHPWALGRPNEEVWREIWHILKPLIETPYTGGPATWMEDIGLEINRNGFIEETHFTIAYSPVPDDTMPNRIGGVLATVHETSEKIVAERRIRVLHDLGARSAESKTVDEACAVAAQTLERHPKDVPFALFYLIDEQRTHAYFAAGAGIDQNDRTIPRTVALHPSETAKNEPEESWPFAAALKEEEIQLVRNISGKFEIPPAGPWADSPQSVAVVAVRSNIAHQVAGFLVLGISSRLQFDESYRNFLELLSTQVSLSIVNARAHAEERKRVEALAEIDRAKTAFFSNVSHEFRTPLALMIGPIHDLLTGSHFQLSSSAKDQLEMVSRNGARLLRLVNTLLDFSSIEAGRVKAVYQETDLAAVTAELAAVFRSATDRAGLRLIVNCRSIREAAYVDREMWEKIVLNLLSNAFKFTFEGEIAVSLKQVGRAVELQVRDTGVGIPSEEIPHLFERFHRVPNTRSRTHEGSGIGLALVNELVKFHGGSMRVESTLGRGSTFFVTIPLGADHLSSANIAPEPARISDAASLNPYVEEALHWLPVETVPVERRVSSGESASIASRQSEIHPSSTRPRVLIADDNADMRNYLARLLADFYQVTAVRDGRIALDSIREHAPDLVLSDVMMPELDGFGLLQKLRSDPATNTIPVILLSARAGEEARLEGLHAGADDYLVKPFSTRELLARVQTHIELARLRRETRDTLELRVRQRTDQLLRMQMDFRALSGKLLRLQDEERRRIARDLHDSAGQTLTVLALNLAQLSDLCAPKDPELAALAAQTEDMVQRLTKEIRTTSYLLHPPLLDESGIAAALRWYIDGLTARSRFKIDLSVSDDFGRLLPETELAVFRIVQESLTNILRHSGSETAEIVLARDPQSVTLRVTDFGKGIGQDKLESIRAGRSGVGMQGMRDRALQVNGQMSVESTASGTTVSVTIPLQTGAPAPIQQPLDPLEVAS